MHVAELLRQLHAAAVAMHVAKAANVHQDVEPEAMPSLERADQLIVPPTMPRAQRHDLVALRRRERHHGAAQLAIAVVALRVQQTCRDLHFQVFVIIK